MPKSHDTFTVKAFLPKELEPLSELAYNLHWSWDHKAIDLFMRLDSLLWRKVDQNPIQMLAVIPQASSVALNIDPVLLTVTQTSPSRPSS